MRMLMVVMMMAMVTTMVTMITTMTARLAIAMTPIVYHTSSVSIIIIIIIESKRNREVTKNEQMGGTQRVWRLPTTTFRCISKGRQTALLAAPHAMPLLATVEAIMRVEEWPKYRVRIEEMVASGNAPKFFDKN